MNNISLKVQFAYKIWWIFSHIFWKTNIFSFFNDRRVKIHEKVLDNCIVGNEELKIQEVDIQDIKLISKLIRKRIPFVIRKASLGFNEWTFDFLETNYGEIIQPTYSDDDDNGKSHQVSIKEVVHKIKSGDKNYNILFGDLLGLKPELKVRTNSIFHKKLFTYLAGFMKSDLLFVSGKGTETYSHSEFGENLFIQIEGKKEWFIHRPKYGMIFGPLIQRKVYFNSKKECHYTSKSEKLKSFPHYRVIIEKGDILYNPGLCWHNVVNLEDSISISSRWSRVSTLFRYPFLSFLVCTATEPSVFNKVFNRKKTNPDSLY